MLGLAGYVQGGSGPDQRRVSEYHCVDLGSTGIDIDVIIVLHPALLNIQHDFICTGEFSYSV